MFSSTIEPTGTGTRIESPDSLPSRLGQHEADRLGGAGRGRHDVHAGGAGAARVAVRAVLQVLLLRVGVHRGHEAVLDAGEVVEHRGQRRERVGRAGGVRDDRVRGRVVRVGVDAVGERDVGAVGRRADEHPLGAGVEVGAGGLGRGEAAGGLEHDVDAELGPRQVGRVALGEHRDAAAVDDEVVPVDLDRAAEPAERAVVGEQVGEGRRAR